MVEARLNACWGYPGQTLSLGPLHTTARHSSSSCSSSGSSFGSSHSGAAAAACDAWRGDRALLVRLLKNLREAYYVSLAAVVALILQRSQQRLCHQQLLGCRSEQQQQHSLSLAVALEWDEAVAALSADSAGSEEWVGGCVPVS